MATSTSQPDIALEAIRQAAAAMLAAEDALGVDERRALAEHAVEELTVFFGALVGVEPEEAWEETARWAEQVQTALMVEGWSSIRKREKRPSRVGALALTAVAVIAGAVGLSLKEAAPPPTGPTAPVVLLSTGPPYDSPKVPAPAWAVLGS